MYERLDKLRAEVERMKARLEDDKVRLKAAEDKLKAAENAQIIADVGALNLTPEQLAQFLAMMQNGQLNRNVGTAVTQVTSNTSARDENENQDNSLKDYDDESEEDDDEIKYDKDWR